MLRFRGKKQRGGWTVVSGRRGAAEVFRENRVPFSIAAAVAVAALVAAYLFLAGPPAVLRHTEKGIAYLREWDYPGAITELETADRLSWKRTPKILYPLGRAYLLDARYDDAAAAFQALAALYGADGGDVTSDGGGVAPDDTDVPPDESGNVSPAGGDVLPDAGEEGDAGAADDAGDVESSLSRAYYGLAEARAYLEDAQAARAAAEEGYRRTGGAEFLTLMAVIDVRPPVSLTPSGVYNGKFIFHFEAEPAGIRTIYTEDGSPVDAGAINAAEYQGGIEADIGEHSFRAVNINRYGMVSAQAAYDITVLDAAGNLNGNIVNGAHVVSRGEQVYYSNGAGVYREELRSGAEAAGDPGAHKLFEGAQTGGLNLLGEWLYFTRAGGAARGIYRVRIDGTGLAKLTDDAAEYLQIAGSRVYYAAREGLCAITPDGGAREVLFEGSIRCLNYADGKLYFIAENPDADAGASAGGDAADAETDEAGPVYCYETEGGSVTRVVGGNAMFLQLYGGSLYYTAAASNGAEGGAAVDAEGAAAGNGGAAGSGEAAGENGDTAESAAAAAGSGEIAENTASTASDASAVADAANESAAADGSSGIVGDGIFISSLTGEPQGLIECSADAGFLIDGDALYYYDSESRELCVQYLSAPQGAVEALARFEAFDGPNLAAGAIYGFFSDGGSAGYARVPAARAGGGAGDSPPEDLSPVAAREEALRFGDALFFVRRDDRGAQSVFRLLPEAAASTEGEPATDGASIDSGPVNGDLATEPVLSGIPGGERLVFVSDSFVLTSDHNNVRLYPLRGDAEGGDAVAGPSAENAQTADTGTGAGETDAAAAAGATPSGEASASAPSTTVSGASAGEVATGAAETGDVEPAEAVGVSASAEDPDSGAGGVGAPGGDAPTDGGAPPGDLSAAGVSHVVEPRLLSDNGLHMWVGLSQVEWYEGRLFFVSQAGFFSADTEFRTAVFICDDGPESYERFKIAGGRVYYRRGGASGEGGLYVMDLDGGRQRRLYAGEAADFDTDGETFYYIDARDGQIFRRDAVPADASGPEGGPVSADVPGDAVRVGEAAELTGDAVTVCGNGDLVVRSLNDGCNLYLYERGGAADSAARKLTEGGAGGAVAFGDFVYYRAWGDRESLYRVDLRGNSFISIDQ